MGKPNFVTGSVVCDPSTLANIDVNIGFVPNLVEVRNYKLSSILTWDDMMAAGGGIVEGNIELNGMLIDCRPAIGSTPANLLTVATAVRIAGVTKAIAAVAAGTALTATTVPQNKWGVFGLQAGADGTIDVFDDTANATGYASEALALAHYRAQSFASAHTGLGYVAVMSTDAGGFVGATTSLADAAVTAHYYSFPLAGILSTDGITAINSGTIQGFRIGTNANVQFLGDTLTYRAWRT
jgi:hypothetical protein